MTWQPIPETGLWDLINAGASAMSIREQRLWESIAVGPEKWAQHPYGELGGGFWVVGIIGSIVVWYNDIEDGFNCLRYANHGVIGEYWCNQDSLDVSVRKLLARIDHGYDLAPFTGPPRPGVFPGPD